MESVKDQTMVWQPIETAPHDRIILLYRPTASEWAKVAPGKWNATTYAIRPNPFWEIRLKIGGVSESRLWAPTHWMPLPQPPTLEET